MKRTINVLAVVVLILVTFGQHTIASADNNTDHGPWITAYASFENFDPSGCIYTYVYLLAVKTSSTLLITIYQYDTCTGAQLLEARNSSTKLPESDLMIDANLDTATLHTTVPVWDSIQNTYFDISLNLTWTGTEALSHGTSNFQMHRPYCHQIDNYHERWRRAQVTGTISDGQTNFTPEPSVYGEISAPKSVYMGSCEELMVAAINPQAAAAMRSGLENYKYSGTYAIFWSDEPTGCIFTTTLISAADITLGPGRGSKLSLMSVSIYQYDSCSQTYVLEAHSYTVPLVGPDLQVSGNSATLKKSVTVYDPDRNVAFDVRVDLTWNASGPLNQNVYTLQLHSPSCNQRGHETWGWREGKASGTISSSEQDFASGPSRYAEINWDRYNVDLCE